MTDDRRFRMSYDFKVGPGKAAAERQGGEGLTDYLLLVSILGEPGGPGGLSAQLMPMGPGGLEDLSPSVAHLVAMTLLTQIPADHRLAASVTRALEMLREPFRRGGDTGKAYTQPGEGGS